MKVTPRDGATGRNTIQWKGSCINKWNQQIKDEGINKNKGISEQQNMRREWTGNKKGHEERIL